MPEFVLNKRRAVASNSPFMNAKLILLALLSVHAFGLSDGTWLSFASMGEFNNET